MYILVALGFILFLVVLSGRKEVFKPIIFILAIPILLWILLRVAMLVGIAFRSGLVGGIILAAVIFYLLRWYFRRA